MPNIIKIGTVYTFTEVRAIIEGFLFPEPGVILLLVKLYVQKYNVDLEQSL